MSHRCLPLLFAVLSVLASCKKQSPRVTVVEESESERSAAVKAAFVDEGATTGRRIDPASPEFAEVDAFLGRFGKAASTKDKAAFTGCLSVDAMVSHIEAKGMISFKTGRERADFIRGAQSSIGGSMGNMAFDRHTLARLEEIAPKQMMAFTRAYDGDIGVVVKMRWWLIKEDDGWKIYDFEELSQGARASTMMGAMAGGLKGRQKAWVQPMLDMSRAMQDLGGDDLVERLAKLRGLSESLLAKSPPPEVESFARHMLVSGMMANGESAEALVELEKLEKLPSVSPGVHFMKGCALTASGKPAEAREAFGRYVEQLGWDSDVHEMMADSYLSEGKRDEALDHALKGLAEEKEATGCLATAAVAAGAARVGELEVHFEASRDPETSFAAVIDYALQSENDETGKAVLALFKAKFPDSELVGAYEEIFAGREPAEAE